MNLQDKLKQAQEKVDNLLVSREQIMKALTEAQRNYEAHDAELRKATKERDGIKAMIAIVPPPTPPQQTEEQAQAMEEKQSVFKALRIMPGTWIAPAGLAVLSSVEDTRCAAILRHAAGLEGIPVEHNGKRGRASAYRWVGGK